jgi:RHS repeat-associated protein
MTEYIVLSYIVSAAVTGFALSRPSSAWLHADRDKSWWITSMVAMTLLGPVGLIGLFVVDRATTKDPTLRRLDTVHTFSTPFATVAVGAVRPHVSRGALMRRRALSISVLCVSIAVAIAQGAGSAAAANPAPAPPASPSVVTTTSPAPSVPSSPPVSSTNQTRAMTTTAPVHVPAAGKPNPGGPDRGAPGVHLLSAKPQFAATQGGVASPALAAPRAVAAPQPPFTECPALGHDTSCGVLVQVVDGGNNIYSDPSQGPYDGTDDTLVGVVNDSTRPVSSLQLSSNTDLFGFEGDGLCVYSPTPAGCPFGPTGYEGPNTSFSNISPGSSGGVVNFTAPLAPGATAYFSLEEALTATAVFSGGPSLSEQGRGSNPSEHSTTCYAKDPINCATGVFDHDFTDFSIPGRGPALNFTRSYSSAAANSDGPFGFGWTDSYGMSLATDATRTVTISQENGSTVSFRPNGYGGFLAPPRVLATLAANPDGSYIFTRQATQIRYGFSAAGQLVSETDLNGNTTTLAYTGSQLATVTDPSGRALTVSYTGAHITKIVDPLARTYAYSYDPAGNLATATDPAGRTYTFTYDANHLLLSMTDARGGTVTNGYDASGRVTSQTDAAGLKSTWAYTGDASSPSGGTTTLTDEHGNGTVYNYANLQLGSVTHAAGTPAAATTSYTYDVATLGRTSATDPLGRVTTNTYDRAGNLTSTTDPAGGRTSYSYNGFNEVTSKTTPAKESTALNYDGAGNLTSLTDPSGKTTTYAHANVSHPGDTTAVTDPDSRTKSLTYDGAGNTASSSVSPTASATDTTKTVYDADSEKVCETAPNATAAGVSCPPAGGARVSNTTTWTYNPDGQVTAVTDPAGHSATTAYDADGNVTGSTDAVGNVTATTYDADNRAVSVKKGANTTSSSTTTTAYDLAPGTGPCVISIAGTTYCTTTTDANGNTTVDALSARSQLLAETRPGGQTTTHQYDLAGQETGRIDAAGRTTTYAYDTASRPTSITYSDGTTPNVGYTYDADSRRTSMTDATGTSTYTYDPNSRLTTSKDGAGNTTSYTFDGAGNTTTLTYPGGKTVTRTFDGAAQLASVTDAAGNATTFGYDADGNPTTTTFPNGDTVASTYDATDRMATTQAAPTASPTAPRVSLTNTRDANEALTQETAGGAMSGTTKYTYDAKLQLTSANGATYNYDPAGNPTGLSSAVSQTFDAADQLTGATKQGVTTGFSFDKLGNRNAATPPTGTNYAYSYDQASRLTAVTSTTKIPTPVVSGLTPNTGPAAGGTTVTITGTGFTGATAVAFGSQPASTFTVVSDTTITATAPPGTGTTDVTVTAPGGTTVTAAADQFTYTTKPGPNILTVFTNSGPAAGGQLALIVATNVTQVSAVHVGTAPAQFFQVPFFFNIGLVLAITPPGTGTVDVTITTPDGSNTTGPADRFTYLQPGQRPAVATAAATPAASTTPPTPVASYTYNGDGLRTSKQTPAGTEQFGWDVSGSQPQLLVDGATNFIYGPDGHAIEQVDGNGTATYLLHDQLGSTRALLAQDGTVAATFTYDAFGQTTSATGTARTPLMYAGGINDTETGFYYLINRYYDPTTAQFLTVDPAFALTYSPFGYVGNNPTNSIDPLGLWGWSSFKHLALGVLTDASGVVQLGADVGTVVAATCVAAGTASIIGVPVAAGCLGVLGTAAAVSEGSGAVNLASTCFDKGLSSDECTNKFAVYQITAGAGAGAGDGTKAIGSLLGGLGERYLNSSTFAAPDCGGLLSGGPELSSQGVRNSLSNVYG